MRRIQWIFIVECMLNGLEAMTVKSKHAHLARENREREQNSTGDISLSFLLAFWATFECICTLWMHHATFTNFLCLICFDPQIHVVIGGSAGHFITCQIVLTKDHRDVARHLMPTSILVYYCFTETVSIAYQQIVCLAV